MSYTISVDTGGTFTDVVIADPTGKLTIGKALTTRDRIFLGMREAIQTAAAEINVTLSALTLIPGVPIGCRSPRKRGPYSMPIHNNRARYRQERLLGSRRCGFPAFRSGYL